MSHRDLDRLFALFCRDGDLEALAAVFCLAAPALLRRARRRLGDAAAAEDVVQELFLSLLQGGARFDGARSSLPFLFGALHRHLDKWQRRRRWCAALPVAVLDGRSDPAHESVQKEERQRIRAAIAELPASCRDVVADYLEHERTPAEIARRTGQRGSTVRVQIHRGLARLRQLLPGVPLLALLSTLSTGRSAAPAEVAPSARRWLLPASAAAALAVLATSSATQPDEVAAATARVPLAAAQQVPEHSLASGNTRERLPEPSRRHALHVTVAAADGAPLPAVGVRVWRAGGDADFAVAHGATDAHGVFLGGELERGEWTVQIDRDQKADVAVVDDRAAQRFVVAGGATVHGVVRDQGGQPVAGAGIWVCDLPRHPWDGQVVAHADDAGRFELRCMPAMSAVAAMAAGRVPSPLQAVGPLPQRFMELRLGGAGAELTGVVVGPAGPVAAVVHIGRKPRAGYTLPGGEQLACLYPGVTVRTGQDGAFAVADLPPGSLEVLARAAEHCDAIVPVRTVAGERLAVRVALAAGLALRGTVRSADGSAIHGALVSARGVSQRHWSAAHSRSDGGFALSGLDPRRIEILVENDDHAPSRFVVTDAQRELAVALAPLPRVSGVLVDAAGAPVDAAQFDFGVRDGAPLRAEPWPVSLDAEARFLVRAAAPDRLQFFARLRGDAVWQRCQTPPGGERQATLCAALPAGFAERATIRLQRHGFTTAELLDCHLFLQRGDDVYHIAPDQPAQPLWVLPPLPRGPWHLHLFGRTGLCPALDLGAVDLPAAGLDLQATAPERGYLRWEIGVQDRGAVEQFRAFLSNARGQQVPLQHPAGRITVPAGRWQVWASSLDFALVRGHALEVRAGEETVLELLRPRAHVRQLAFWLPRGVDAAAATVQLCCNGVPVLGGAAALPGSEGLEDSGFECGPDGFCSIVMALGDGRYRLALDTGSGTFAAEFDVAGPGSDAAPCVLELAPVQ